MHTAQPLTVASTVTIATPRTAADWQTPSRELAALLFGRASFLRNSLNAATSRDAAMQAALVYLRAGRELAATCEAMTGEVSFAYVGWLTTCTNPAFASDAIAALRKER